MDDRLRPLLAAPAWLEAGGADDDVVVAARVRLARNLADGPFPQQMEPEAAGELCRDAGVALADSEPAGELLAPDELDPTDGEFLVERSALTRDLLHAGRPALVWFEPRGEQRMLKNCAAGYSRELPLLMTCPSGHPNRQVDILPRVRVVVVFLLDRFEPRGEVQDEPIVRARLHVMSAIVEM